MNGVNLQDWMKGAGKSSGNARRGRISLPVLGTQRFIGLLRASVVTVKSPRGDAARQDRRHVLPRFCDNRLCPCPPPPSGRRPWSDGAVAGSVQQRSTREIPRFALGSLRSPLAKAEGSAAEGLPTNGAVRDDVTTFAAAGFRLHHYRYRRWNEKGGIWDVVRPSSPVTPSWG